MGLACSRQLARDQDGTDMHLEAGRPGISCPFVPHFVSEVLVPSHSKTQFRLPHADPCEAVLPTLESRAANSPSHSAARLDSQSRAKPALPLRVFHSYGQPHVCAASLCLLSVVP